MTWDSSWRQNMETLLAAGNGAFIEFTYHGKVRMGHLNYVSHSPSFTGWFAEVYVAAEQDGRGGWDHNVGYKRFTMVKIEGPVVVRRAVNHVPVAGAVVNCY